jgi:pimeloyl-ACP methyl ester carboxylesterase
MNPRIGSVRCLSPSGFHTIRYREFGDATNRNIAICVHGLTRNATDFDALANELCKTHRVICPDVVGRGQSDWLHDWHHYGFAQYLADANALITSVCSATNVEQVNWIGTSMGGLIGMLLAAMPVKPGTENPIRKLVMNDVGPLMPKAALERITAYVGRDPVFPSMAHYVQYVKAISPFGELTDAQWQKIAASGAATQADGSVKSHYDPGIGDAFRAATNGKPIEDIDLFGEWNKVMAPTLVIRGESSDLLSRETHQQMGKRPNQNVTLVEFANCGHAPALLDATQIETITKFVR